MAAALFGLKDSYQQDGCVPAAPLILAVFKKELTVIILVSLLGLASQRLAWELAESGVQAPKLVYGNHVFSERPGADG